MVILDKYPFENGVFKTLPHFAVLMAPILCGSYAAKLTYEGTDEAPTSDDLDDASLSIESTRGRTEGEKMADSDLAAKLEHARRQEAAEAALSEQRATERALLDAAQGVKPVEAAKPATKPAPAAEAKK